MAFTIQYTAPSGEIQTSRFAEIGLSPDLVDVYMVDGAGQKVSVNDMRRPIVLDGAEELSAHVHSIDKRITTEFINQVAREMSLSVADLTDDARHNIEIQLYSKLDNQLLPLKVSLKMSEIMLEASLSPQRMSVDSHMPVIFKVQTDGRTRVGWHFEKNAQAKLGSVGHYDHGTSVGHALNKDKEVLAALPMRPEHAKQFMLSLPLSEKPISMIFLLNDGTLLGGTTFFQESTNRFQINGVMVTMDEVACATQLPEQNSLAWHRKAEAGNPGNNEYVFAWDNDRVQQSHSGPYVDFAKFDATGQSNRRYQGTDGPFFGGEPWSSKKSWNSLEGVAAHTMLREFHALRQYLTQKIVPVQQMNMELPKEQPSGYKPQI